MVRALWLTGLLAALAQAQEQSRTVTVAYDNSPRAIDNLNSTLAVTPTVLHPDSPLLSLTPNRLHKRRTIDVTLATELVVAGATVIIAANAAADLYDNIAAKIKAKSDANSCTLTYGTDSDDGYYEGYAYQATTTGTRCDTTSILETIQNAVQECANDLHNAGAVRGCCRFSHGGTWTGHLRLTADPVRYPVTSVDC